MQKKIAQLVDFSGNLPRHILNKYEIKEVPVSFSFDNNHYYRENNDLDTKDFYLHMKNQPEKVPKTAAANIHDWIEAFKEMYEKGYRRFVVTAIASQLSGTMENARQAREIFLSKQQDVDIFLLETNTCACGQAALEIKIAQILDREDLLWEDFLERAKNLVPRVTSLFSVQELTYMKAGGRIGGATAFLGNLIKIKPICEFINGTVHPIKAVRGRKKSLQIMADTALSRIKNVQNAIIVTQNALCEEDETFMIDYLRYQLQDRCCDVFRSMVGTTVGAHSGPGAIGIGFVEDY
ncbi:MAG: DegV family protein [Bacillota bacterium]|nr:DegV family protein [Bacillota bacterium]